MTPPSPVAELVARVRAGDAESLGALYDLTAPRLRRIAQRALGDLPDAEDVVHDLFVGLPDALRHYREAGRIESWLVRCLMRLVQMRRRTTLRRRETAWDAVDDVVATDRPDLAPEVAEVLHHITMLPATLRDVVVLRVEGLSHAEIAAVLGITEGNSRIRLARALEQLLPLRHSASSHSVPPARRPET